MVSVKRFTIQILCKGQMSGVFVAQDAVTPSESGLQKDWKPIQQVKVDLRG